MTYDKAENKAYYVKKPPNQHRDEIYAYDMKTGKTSQLTTDLFSVNIILPVKDRIFFAGRGIDMKNLRLGAIDKSTGAITYWKDDGDTNVWSFSVDDEKQKIYMSTFSTKERFVNIHLPEFVQETNIIYETDYNFQNTKQLYSKEHEWYRMVMANGDHLLILHSVAGTGTTEPIYLNLETGQTDEFTLPDTVIHQGTAFFSKNGKYLYFSGYNASVYRYNIYTKKTKCIFTAPEGAYINNFVLYQ